MGATSLKAVLVVPDTNTTMEREVRALWPELGTLYRVGVPRPMRPIVAGDLPEYRANTLRQLAALPDKDVDVVLYGCTTAGFLAGPEGDLQMQQALSDAVGAPAVTTASSMVVTLRDTGAMRPAIVTPYLEASNLGLIRYLQAKGIAVSSLRSFFFTTTEQYDRVTADQVLDLATETGQADTSADSLFIACTQLPTRGLLPQLQARLRRPAFSAVQATVEAGRRAVAEGT